ncbi:MAG: methyltransferase domain-containing protein, partial [Bacillota bacterium]
MQQNSPAGAPAETIVTWTEAGRQCSARWRSESGAPAPRRIAVADDSMNADTAYRLACEGTALLWRGDFQNARQLLAALARRVERRPRRAAPPRQPASPAEAFHLHRQAQARRARILGMLLVPLDADYGIALRRAPDVRLACSEAWGPGGAPSLVSLRELQGLIGAHEWRKKGVHIPALGARIHPWYGVFSPVRGEYVDLVAQAPLPATSLAFDIGTGTGVLAALLARRGVARVVATDQDARALACARDNIERLGLTAQVEIARADLFPPGRAPL